MRIAPDIIPCNRTRTRRLTAWFRLWLQSLVFACSVWMTTGWRGDARLLDAAAACARRLVLRHVCERMGRWPPRSRNRHGRLNHVTRRIEFGSALRRATRGRDHASRLFAILTLMRDLDAHVTRVARRLKRGLTRLRVIDPVPEKGPALVAACGVVAGVDTS